MAQLRSYNSIKKPSLGSSSSFSSYAQSLVKRTNSAEDAVIDGQYESGQISAEVYQSHLTRRLTRDYITPLQRVTIQDKITKVATQVYEAEVDRKYAAGEYSTDQVLQYERDKLGGIPQADTVAYQRQAQKVQGLTDKAEREKRTAYRVSENLRISQMPEDTSERLYQKAQMYKQLEQQARLDGDNQTADTLATSANNYEQSAKRASINDQYTTLRSSIARTPKEGLGVPTSTGGQAIYGGGSGQSAPASLGQGGVGVGGSGGGLYAGLSLGSGGSSSAVNNAFKSLDATKKSYERLSQQRDDATTYINGLAEIIGNATGDQRTSFEIQYDNAVQSLRVLDDQLAKTEVAFQDNVARIQEAQAAAARKAFSQNISLEDKKITQEIEKLQQDFAKGKIDKETYITALSGFEGTPEGEELKKQVQLGKLSQDEAEKLLYGLKGREAVLSEIAMNGYGDYDDPRAVTYQTKLLKANEEWEDARNKLADKDAFESVFSPKDKKYQLTYIRDIPDFDQLHVKLGKGFHLVEPRGENFQYYDAQGNKVKGIDDELAKMDNAFKTFILKDGKLQEVGIKYTKMEDGIAKPIGESAFNLEKERGTITINNAGIAKYNGNPFKVNPIKARLDEAGQNIGDAFAGKNETVNVIKKKFEPIAKKILEVSSRNYRDEKGIKSIYTVDDAASFINKARQNFGGMLGTKQPEKKDNKVQGLVPTAIKNASGFIKGTADAVARFFAPPAEASYSGNKKQIKPTEIKKSQTRTQGVTGSIGQIIDQIADKYSGGNPEFRKVLHAIALTESGGNPNAVGDNGESIGLFQNRMKFGRGGNFTKDQLFDPVFNTDISAKELVNYFKQGVSKGLKGADLVAYVSRYGQRPAAGLEWHVAKNYGRFVESDEAVVTNEPHMMNNFVRKADAAAPKIPLNKPQPIPTGQKFVSPIPQSQIVRSQPKPNPVQQVINSLPKVQVPQFQLPKIQVPQLPKITMPQMQLPKIQAPKLPSIQNVVSNISRGAQTVAKTVGDTINKFNPFAKKK